MKIEKITDSNRHIINEFLNEHWYSTTMVVKCKEIDLKYADGFFIREDNSIIGLITYFVYDKEMEITSLDSLHENHGVGTELVNAVINDAKIKGCDRISLITTNDNINAIRFYQKRGFDMIKIYRNAVDIARTIKPSIPLIAENSIPIRHEIEFELIL